MVTVGCDRVTSEAALAVAEQHDDVWAPVGRPDPVPTSSSSPPRTVSFCQGENGSVE